MSNEITHFFGAFVDVEVRLQDYELIVRQCVNGHKSMVSFQYCPDCGEPMNEQRIPQRRYPTDHYELLDDDLADTLTDTTPRDMYGSGHIVLRSNESNGTAWMEIHRHTHDLLWSEFPTDAQQKAMKSALMAMPAVKVLQDHPQVANVTAWCGYVEDAEY